MLTSSELSAGGSHPAQTCITLGEKPEDPQESTEVNAPQADGQYVLQDPCTAASESTGS